MTDQIRFLAHHRPALSDGDYVITVEQNTDAGGDKDAFRVERKFSVEGERFSLAPAGVHAVFPPPNSGGDHAGVLPHVVLRKSTLPWERSAEKRANGTPWLAVLVFTSGEATELTAMLEGQQVNVVDVPRKVVERLLPTAQELRLLAHVREVDRFAVTDRALDAARSVLSAGDIANLRRLGDTEFTLEKDFASALERTGSPAPGTIKTILQKGWFKSERALAVVVGSRLPSPHGTSFVHLVSLEGRYANGHFDYGGAKADDAIRFVSLHSFRFRCDEPRSTFTQLLKHAQCGTLRLAPSADRDVERASARGAVPLRHKLRQGKRTVSWYQGPLIPAKVSATTPGSARTADELVRFQPATGMFDVSYAAAWELGRLSALRSKAFSLELHRWKRAHAEHRAHDAAPTHLPLAKIWRRPPEPSVAPAELVEWFRRLNLLEGVPFSYLVPDERLLPAESLRFFHFDPVWVDHLLDGAFSVGRAPGTDPAHEAEHRRSGSFATPHRQLTGVLVRSKAVSGWPTLQVDGHGAHPDGKTEGLLDALRCERLAPDVLLALFAGELRRVEIHPRPETLHFGFTRGDAHDHLKDLRPHGKVAPIPWRPSPTDRDDHILDVTAFCKKLELELGKPVTAAEFALQMIEGVEKISVELRAP